jgi:hypothetical protein
VRNRLRSWRRYLGLLIPVATLLVIVGGVIWFTNRQLSPETLAKNRDMAIILIAVLAGFSMFLLSIMVGVVIWLLIVVKDKIVPVMDTVQELTTKVKATTDVVADNVVDTSSRVKNTTDFVTEEVAAPLIKAYGFAAQGRAWVRVVTGRTSKPEGSAISRAFRKPE